jgi:glutathione synthase/RimK-type ligase-like ATP-grasp enzyme
VTVVGTRVFAAAIDSQASRLTRHDWRHYDNERARYSPFELPAPIRAACRRLLRALGLTFGAIDLVVTPEGEYVFIEINPNGQWGWVEDLTRMQIGQAIADFLIGKAARKRRR